MSALEAVAIPSAAWRDEAIALRDRGFAMLDVLAAVDRLDAIEVVVHLVDPKTGDRLLAATRVPSEEPRLASLATVLPAATWHEREAAEMFGITFVDHPDPRLLLLHATPDTPPLLKSAPLPARLAMTWPGAVEVEAGRRARRPQLPPGVRAEWVREEES